MVHAANRAAGRSGARRGPPGSLPGLRPRTCLAGSKPADRSRVNAGHRDAPASGRERAELKTNLANRSWVTTRNPHSSRRAVNGVLHQGVNLRRRHGCGVEVDLDDRRRPLDDVVVLVREAVREHLHFTRPVTDRSRVDTGLGDAPASARERVNLKTNLANRSWVVNKKPADRSRVDTGVRDARPSTREAPDGARRLDEDRGLERHCPVARPTPPAGDAVQGKKIHPEGWPGGA